MTEQIPPPVAPKRPQSLVAHGDERIDDWYWIQNKQDPAVRAHLELENAYTAKMLEHTEGLQKDLFEEIVKRIQETDLSVPVRKNGWWYLHRTEEGKQYAIHCRRQENSTDEVVIFDENVEAGDGFFDLGTFDISADGNLLAYSVDRAGDELYDMRIRDLRTGIDLPDRMDNLRNGSAWSLDGRYLFYTRPDDKQRPFQVWRHEVGTDSATDALVYQEDDETFWLSIGNSRTDDWIVINGGSFTSSETHVLRADDPTGAFQVVEPRRENVEYHLAHHKGPEGEFFYVHTNEDAPNFKLMRTPCDAPSRQNWVEVIAHRADVRLEAAEAFTEHLVLSERTDAITRIVVAELPSMRQTVIEQPEEIYTAGTSGNAEFDTTTLRFNYTSMVTPSSVYEYDMKTGERTLLKQQPVLGGYDPADYVTKREWATSHDGVKVPISLVQRRDRPAGPGPALLYGYGSYEMSMDPYFSSIRMSLLDRGFTFAIAHVRGGGEMGRRWYEDGKFKNKLNTFHDFIACAERLVEAGYTTPQKLAARGGSAGGMLMGAIANMRPDLFGAVVAEVPFVDVLTGLLDTSLPLTAVSWDEWGNPAEKDFYDYIKSYSPYDNVAEAPYPNVLATSGFNDPRVEYWDATKWVQALREKSTSANTVLLKTEMGAGHSGPSGRYDAWRDEAFIYAFLIDSVG